MTRLDADAMFLAGGHALLPGTETQARRSAHPDRPGAHRRTARDRDSRGWRSAQAGGNSASGGAVRIGAMTTSAEIEYSPDVARVAPLLSRAAAVISDPLIRNRATLGGSLAEADPHGDWPPVVLAVDATVHLRSRDGERALPASEFFTIDGDGRGSERTALRPGELLTAVTVPAADCPDPLHLSQAHASRVRARDARCGGRRHLRRRRNVPRMPDRRHRHRNRRHPGDQRARTASPARA